MRRTSGFTLIEVLVALAIVTIGMAAVMEALTSSANAAVYLRNKTFAEWVAVNQVERVRLSGTFPGTGTSTGHVRFAHRRWHWRQKIIQTKVPGVERIVVDVRPKHGSHHNWYATATGYVGNAIEPPNPASPLWTQGAPGGSPVPNTPNGNGPGGPGPQPVTGQPSSSIGASGQNPVMPPSLP